MIPTTSPAFGLDETTVPQGRDAIRQREDLLAVVGDVEHRHTLVREVLDQAEQVLALLGVERHGWLVEHQQPRIAKHRPGDRQLLPFGNRQEADSSRLSPTVFGSDDSSC